MKIENITISDTAIGLDELVDHRVASKITGLSPRTVQNLATARKLPFYKVGNRLNRYLVRELLEWCESRKVACVA
jgi:predicted DNA-binding transcriptional regulator AlpA